MATTSALVRRRAPADQVRNALAAIRAQRAQRACLRARRLAVPLYRENEVDVAACRMTVGADLVVCLLHQHARLVGR